MTKQVQEYLQRPAPLWEHALTRLLVNELTNEIPDSLSHGFYESHGLERLSPLEMEESAALQQIDNAITTLTLIPPLADFLNSIIKTVQILKAEGEETDISYSHPELPFTIFLSVCKDTSLRSTLRVAESILHEAMHLKLTLIENAVPLVSPFTGNVIFSPWRDEKRPARGVLHGLFVFRAILDYFEAVKDKPEVQTERAYIEKRISQIKTDLAQLTNFVNCTDLTKDGATLTKNLLPSN